MNIYEFQTDRLMDRDYIYHISPSQGSEEEKGGGGEAVIPIEWCHHKDKEKIIQCPLETASYLWCTLMYKRLFFLI